jgi:EAL domain-containing protein (putative c-di-GMP-specific phosphodiesterase class I)/DNA-binding CsgD family transcriptional regulator
MDDDPTGRRIIGFGASRRRFAAAECKSVEELILRASAQKPSHLFIGVECANSDAIEIIRHLEAMRYRGVLHLMGADCTALLHMLTEVGKARGLSMGHPLQKPFRRSAIESILSEGATAAPPLEELGRTAPPLTPVDRGILLRDAIAAGAVEIVYQPRFDLETGRPCGAEATARHSQLHAPLSGRGSSATMEDIDHLSKLLLNSALSAWRRFARPSFQPTIKLRMPVSSLSRLPLGEIIRSNRPQSRDWPGIVIEPIGADVTSDPSKIREIAAQLQIYGLGLSFGELGTGRTALRALESISPAELAINRVFVANSAHRQFSKKVCKSLIAFAESLGARSVAEGIQSEDDIATLIELGCDTGQGDILAKKLTAEEFDRFIARGTSLTLPERRPPQHLLHFRRSDSRLTLREIEVLELIAVGKSSKEAGQALGLSPRTIDVYRAKLMAKLNARNVAELVKVALTARH